MSLQELQAALDGSISSAKGFSRDLFSGKQVSAEAVERYSNEHGSMIIATIDRERRPHAAVVAAGCAGGVLYIGVTPRTALLGNLRRSPDVAFAVEEKIVGQGEPRLIGKAREGKDLAPSLGATLRGAIEQDWEGYLYSVTPRRIFATLE